MVTRMWRWLVVVLHVAAICWQGSAIATALLRGEGHGSVFVAAVIVLSLILMALLFLLPRTVRWARRGDGRAA